jgi:thiol-disulfide isomerase/thioredoxin
MPFEVNRGRRHFLGAAAMAMNSLPWKWFRFPNADLPIEGSMPSLRGASGWLNSAQIDRENLRGKVTLVDFWTYSCINWRRTLPYLRAWVKKYQEHGLVVVGVHSPEFQFEKNIQNVGQAAKSMMIDYPIAVDSDLAIWRDFSNQYWPALYLIDAKGRIRHRKFGEGDYDKSEYAIQQLLAENGAAGFDHSLALVEASGAELGADWRDLRSGENYLGYERTENFASRGGYIPDKRHTYASPPELLLNHWALAGEWTARKQSISLEAGDGRIAYQFHARDLHLVMGPREQGRKVRFRVNLDGHVPLSAHGVDTDSQGFGTVEEPRMYQLIRQQPPIIPRRFEIEFLEPGAEAYSFTFG